MFGKIVGGLLGLLVAGIPGLVIGILAGHWFDRGLAHNLRMVSPARLAAARDTFFSVSFELLGHIAKADGRISEAEIAQAEILMKQLGIGGDQRDLAIGRFKAGAEPGFDVAAAVARFNRDCAGPRQIAHTLLLFLLGMALADGEISPSERQALDKVAQLLGYSAVELQQLLEMFEAQAHFHDFRPGDRPAAADQIADAYRALGVDASCSDRELKRAYRKLMSEHHPDKLIAQGVPESMLKVATEKSQEIQAAYELVKKSRGQ